MMNTYHFTLKYNTTANPVEELTEVFDTLSAARAKIQYLMFFIGLESYKLFDRNLVCIHRFDRTRGTAHG